MIVRLGTHLGVRGCYTEKEFVSEDEVRKHITKKYPKGVKWDKYMSNNNIVHCFENRNNCTECEYLIKGV